jgi:Tfp pilus assembly protein PilF
MQRSVEDTQGQAFALTNLGMAALAQGQSRRARPLFEASLRLFRSLGDLRNSAEALEGLAEVALRENDAVTAVQLLGTASSYRIEIGAPLAAHARFRIDQIAEAARIHLGESAFEEAWTVGQLQAKDHQVRS